MPTAEESTASEIYRAAGQIALSDEPGTTVEAIRLTRRGDEIAKMEVAERTSGYRSAKDELDEALKDLNEDLEDIKKAVNVVKRTRDVVKLIDSFLVIAADVIV